MASLAFMANREEDANRAKYRTAEEKSFWLNTNPRRPIIGADYFPRRPRGYYGSDRSDDDWNRVGGLRKIGELTEPINYLLREATTRSAFLRVKEPFSRHCAPYSFPLSLPLSPLDSFRCTGYRLFAHEHIALTVWLTTLLRLTSLLCGNCDRT